MFLFHFPNVSLSFLCRFLFISFTNVSFPFPPFLFLFFRVSFPFLSVFVTRNGGGGSSEGAGRTEDFDQNPRLTCSKHGRTYDNHKALFHVLGVYGEILLQMEASTFPYRFQNISIPFLYHFFTVSEPFLYRFRVRFFTVSITVSFPSQMGTKCSQRFL